MSRRLLSASLSMALAAAVLGTLPAMVSPAAAAPPKAWNTVGGGAGIGGVPDGVFLPSVNDIVVDGTGKVYVAGRFSTVYDNDGTAVDANGLAVFDPASGTWDEVAGGVSKAGASPLDEVGVRDMVLDGSNLYIAGYFDSVGSTPAGSIARIDLTSEGVDALGGGAEEGQFFTCVNTLLLDGTTLYAGGSFSKMSGTQASGIAALDTSTSTWSGLSGGLGGMVNAIVAAPDGSIYAGGDFAMAYNTLGADYVSNVAKWNPSTTSWSALGQGADRAVAALLLDGTTLYVGGFFSEVTDLDTTRHQFSGLASYDAGEWSSVGTGIAVDDSLDPDLPAPCSVAQVTELQMYAGVLYVGGCFAKAGGSVVSNLAAWNGTTWSAIAGGVGGGLLYATKYAGYASVRAIAVTATDLYVGGMFTGTGPAAATYDGRNAAGLIARYGTPSSARPASLSDAVMSVQPSREDEPDPYVDALVSAVAWGVTGAPQPSLAYEWQMSDTENGTFTAIAGADASKASWVVPDSLVGKYIRVKITASNTGGSDTATSAAALVPGEAPTIYAGTFPSSIEAGREITVTGVSAYGVPEPTLSYAWQTSSTVDGTYTTIDTTETGTYSVPTSAAGAFLRVVVTASNSQGDDSWTSGGVLVSESTGTPPAIESVTLSHDGDGRPQVGDTLTVTASGITGDPEPAVTYRWEASDDDGETWGTIGRQRGAELTVPGRLAGQRIRAVVTATNAIDTAQRRSRAVTIAAIPAPTEVRDLTATQVGKDRIRVTWTAPKGPKRAPATSYLVTWRQMATPPWRPEATTTSTSFVVKGRFGKGLRYSIRVIPVNVAGEGDRAFARITIE